MVNFELLCETFNNLTKSPDKFLSSGLLTSELKSLLKDTYDFGQNYERHSKKALPELIINEFDDEQIWQELELQNEDSLPTLINKAARLLVSKNLDFPVKTDASIVTEDNHRTKIKGKKIKKDHVKHSEAISSDEETDEEENLEDDGDFWSETDENIQETGKPKKVKIIPSEVDDNFFKLSEMEAFLKDQEENGDNLGAGIDLFGEMLSGSEDENDRPMYNAFFNEQNGNDNSGIDEQKQSDEDDLSNKDMDEECQEDFNDISDDDLYRNSANNRGSLGKEKSKKVKFDLQSDSDSEVSSGEDKIKSSFEVREERLRKKITELEEEALQEKAWPLKGEVSASVRPMNSLLEEVVEFDTAQRPAPIITEETTNRLEDIIKQRIRDQAYDDVERKIKPVATPNEFKKKLVLDQEKSKLSLSQVYEQEYLKQKTDQTQADVDKPEVEPEEHQIIKKMMNSLFTKLDALSNFFFVPKPIAPDLKIVSNLPAIEMEEVAPLTTSDAKLLAPEEVGGAFKKSLLAKEERTKTDQKRERRKKKALQAKKFKAKALKDANKTPSYNEELKKVMKFKNVSKLEEKVSNSSKTSKDFFTKLQDEVQNQLSQKDNLKKRKSKQSMKTAKKLKL